MATLTTHLNGTAHEEATNDKTVAIPVAPQPPTNHGGWSRGWLADRTPLPPLAVLLARPVILAVCAALGALVGFIVTDGSGYKAVAAVEFTVDGNDVALVEVEGRTLADRMITAPVIKRAAAAINESPEELKDSTDAAWVPSSSLVEVTATASTPTEAWTRANAMVDATIADFRDDANRRLDVATTDANSLIGDRPLADPDAETARRAQVGTSLGDRQHALTERSESITIARKATEATSAGLTADMGAAIGLAAGLFVGCLIALFLGTRGLRTWSLTTLRRLAPGVDVSSTNQLPKFVGALAESGDTSIAVIVPRNFVAGRENFVGETERLLALHGKSTVRIQPPVNTNEASKVLLNGAESRRIRERSHADMLLMVVDEDSEDATVLQGRSGFRTIVLLRRHKSAVSGALAAANAYGPSQPVLMLAR